MTAEYVQIRTPRPSAYLIHKPRTTEDYLRERDREPKGEG